MTSTLAPADRSPDTANDNGNGNLSTPPGGRVTYPLGWLRGLAALSVVTFHAYQHNRGAGYDWPLNGAAHQAMLGSDLFVEMFFVLSGLVLWLPVARAVLDRRTGRSGRSLLFRRLARLVPLYYTVVLVVWALTNPSLPGHWADLFTHLTFTHIYSDDYIFWTAGPAWSLAVEFHFYLLVALAVPLVSRAAGRATTRRGRLTVLCALPVALLLTSGVYLTWAIHLGSVETTNWSVWFSPLSRAADFGLGMLLAVLGAAGVRLRGRVRAGLAIGSLVVLATLVLQRPAGSLGEWWHPAYAAAICLGLAAVVLHDGPWPAWLSWRPLGWLGGLGYGIYLIHEPVMRLLGSHGLLPDPAPGGAFLWTAVLVAVPTVLLAWLSQRTVEAAGLRLLQLSGSDGRPRDYYAHLQRR